MKKIFIIIVSLIGIGLLIKVFESSRIVTETLGVSVNYYVLVPVMAPLISFIIFLVSMFFEDKYEKIKNTGGVLD
jgi:phosphate/sulfate permease